MVLVVVVVVVVVVVAVVVVEEVVVVDGACRVRRRRHLHLLNGEDSEAGEGGDVVGQGGHGAAVEDQLLQADQPPRLLRQPPQIVVLPHSSIGTLYYRYAVLCSSLSCRRQTA